MRFIIFFDILIDLPSRKIKANACDGSQIPSVRKYLIFLFEFNPMK